ncbi:MAG TPA: alpha/beta fold hydrolase [Xanthomonadales bacterium]|nr:alpha/beta fold hydrolase [Xanthomonadales bacterium]
MNELEFLPVRARHRALARGLQLTWGLQLAVLALWVLLQVRAGAGWWQAAALAAAVWVGLQLGLMAFGFGLKWVSGDWPAATRGPGLRWLRTAAVEMGWMARIYLVEHPWRAAPVQLGAEDRRAPLLLVHGFLCNGAVWIPLARHLAGRNLACVSLEPSYRHFERQLQDLHEAVLALCARTGRAQVTLVGHSMGALLSRAYAQRYPQRLAAVVCVAAPHHGTLLADFIYGVEAGPPSARCQWLMGVNQRDGERIGVPALNLWSADDNIVIPARSASLSGTPERTLHGHGHMAAIAAPSACAILVKAIEDLESTLEQAA